MGLIFLTYLYLFIFGGTILINYYFIKVAAYVDVKLNLEFDKQAYFST